jgi:hypothetical protein
MSLGWVQTTAHSDFQLGQDGMSAAEEMGTEPSCAVPSPEPDGKDGGISMAEKVFTVVATREFKRFVGLALLTAASGFSSTIAYDSAVKITGNQAFLDLLVWIFK